MKDLLPPCTAACPVQTDVRGYLASIARRDYAGAYRLIRANNPFPSVCAWVCPHPCEEACRRGQVEAPVSIRNLKRFVVDTVGEVGEEHGPVPPTGKAVAVIGAGPAGLASALELVRLGHRAVVYDRLPYPGGHFLTSLPAYRLPREMLRRDVEQILAAGVEIRTGVEIGRDITVNQLRRQYDAVIISSGLWAGRRLDLPGFDHPDVLPALRFLGMANAGKKLELGKRVAVIGGGDVAVDAARTALRLGASEVLIACLEPRELMPARAGEIEEALLEGVKLEPECSPVELLQENGRIKGLVIQKIINRQVLPCDSVILAIGQVPDNSFLQGSGLEDMLEGFRAAGDQERLRGVDGVFICGEIAAGPGPVIEAVASGQRTAAVAAGYLKGEETYPDLADTAVIEPLPGAVAQLVPRRERREMPVLPPVERIKNLLPYQLGFSEAAALAEAGRCLSCGLGARVDEYKCVDCLTCHRVCPYEVPLVEGRAGIPVAGCQACGICASFCPARAINVEVLSGDGVLASLAPAAVKDRQVVFACRGVRTDTDALARMEQERALAGGLVVEVPTSGAVSLEWLLKAVEAGAAGVAVVSCRSSRCCFAGGENHLESLMVQSGPFLENIGMPRNTIAWYKL